jgi:hypothetical protein
MRAHLQIKKRRVKKITRRFESGTELFVKDQAFALTNLLAVGSGLSALEPLPCAVRVLSRSVAPTTFTNPNMIFSPLVFRSGP